MKTYISLGILLAFVYTINNLTYAEEYIDPSYYNEGCFEGCDESDQPEQVIPQEEPAPQNYELTSDEMVTENNDVEETTNSFLMTAQPVKKDELTSDEMVTENNDVEETANSFIMTTQPVTKIDVKTQPGVVTIINISGNYDQTAQLILVSLNGQVADNKDGTLTYISNLHFRGIEQIKYTLLYKNGKTFTFKVMVEVRLIEKEQMPAQCSIYAVHDDGISDSQLLVIEPNQEYNTVTLGHLYKKLDIEGLEIDPITKQLYAISSIGTSRDSNVFDGYFYNVNPKTGDLTVVGDTGFSNTTALAFHQQDGTLWAWSNRGAKDGSDNSGIIQIDPKTAKSTLVVSANELFGKKSKVKRIESLAWNSEGTILYAGENSNLWAYDGETFEKQCTNLPGKAEALETLKDGMLLFTLHNRAGDLLSVYYDPENCQVVDTPLAKIDGYYDIESLAWSLDCQNTVEDILALQLAKILGADNVRLEKEGTLFVELDGQVHQGLLAGSLTQVETPEILSLAPLGKDVNGDGYNDFKITYSDGQEQKVFYLGVVQ